MEFSLLYYFYGISYDAIGDLTYPQYRCLLHNLFVIKKIENGSNSNADSNLDKKATEDWIDDNFKNLQAKTGRNDFSLAELSNPLQTIKRHQDTINKEKN